jgi:prepilin-type processing-associated H-X9-DG protein
MDWPIGYGYNIALGYFPYGQYGTSLDHEICHGVALASLSAPSDLIAFLDNSLWYATLRNNFDESHEEAYWELERFWPANHDGCMEWFNWPDSGKLYSPVKAGPGGPSGRHSGGVNCAFADGHSKWLKTGGPLCETKHFYPHYPANTDFP